MKSLSCTEVIEASAAYALDALEPEEKEGIEAHLASCPNCSAVIAANLQVVELLAYAAPSTAVPPGLKQRLLAEAVRLRPPVTRRRSLRAYLTGLLAAFGRPPVLAADPGRQPGRTGSPAWAGSWVAAGAILALLVVVPWNLNLQHQLTRQQGMLQSLQAQATAQASALARATTKITPTPTTIPNDRQELLSILAATNLTLVSLHALNNSSGQAEAYIDPAQHRLALISPLLGQPPPGHIYQLWIIQNGIPKSIGVFTPSSSGNVLLIGNIPNSVTNYRTLAVTTEPGQGSLLPTGPAFLSS